MNWDIVLPAIPGALFGVAAVIQSWRTHSTVNGKLELLMKLKDDLAATAMHTSAAASAAAEAAAYLKGQADGKGTKSALGRPDA